MFFISSSSYFSQLPLPANTEKLIKKPAQNWYGGHKDTLIIAINDLKNRMTQGKSVGEGIINFAKEVINSAITTYFSGTTLSKEQTKLLIACYMIHNHVTTNRLVSAFRGRDLHNVTDHIQKLNLWIKEVLKCNQAISLDPNDLYQVYFKFEDNIFYFGKDSNSPKLNLEKILKASSHHSIIYNIRQKKLASDLTFYGNNDRTCLGKSLFWLFNTHAAVNSHSSRALKQEFAEALRVNNRAHTIKEMSYNSETPQNLIIEELDFNKKYFNTLFHHIQDITAIDISTVNDASGIPNNVTFGHAVLLIIALLKQNKLNQIYVRIYDLKHAMAMAITTEGDSNKILIHDPNNEFPHFSFYLGTPEFSSEHFKSIKNFNQDFGNIILAINRLIRSSSDEEIPHLHYVCKYSTNYIGKIGIGGPYYNFKCYASSLNSNKFTLTSLANTFFEETADKLLELSKINRTHDLDTNTINQKSIAKGEDPLNSSKVKNPSDKIKYYGEENAFAMRVALMTENPRLIKKIMKHGEYRFPTLPPHACYGSNRNKSIEKIEKSILKNA